MAIKVIILLPFALMMYACEKPVFDSEEYDDGNAVLVFTATSTTRSDVVIGDYFTKLNVMLFDANGEKVFDKVRTQYSTDNNFGQMSLQLAEGEYTVVAVGHSSVKSATIKSPQVVQFTASNGEKLTDTFCYCGQITVSDEPEQHDLVMSRVTALFRMVLTDEEIPSDFTAMKIDYTGGSANFNPSTGQGCTKSTQSETRTANQNDIYDAYTFPYMATESLLNITVSALDASGTIIRQRTFTNVPVTRNKITTYTGHFFEPGDGDITQSGFGFSVNGDWEGEDNYTF